MSAAPSISIEIVQGDVLDFPSDVLALKYARKLYGVDAAVVKRLEHGSRRVKLPAVDQATFVSSEKQLNAQNVLFMGVPPLHEFDYAELRRFGRKVCTHLAVVGREIQHLSLTVNGPGFGLDEVEAFESVLAGIIEAISTKQYPSQLRRVSFVEIDRRRVERLTLALDRLLPRRQIDTGTLGPLSMLETGAQTTLRSVGYASASKPRIFVAMPFSKDMDDVFHYGIQGAANAAGMLCERADLSVFTGDVNQWIMRSIDSAALVVADLSGANANVYLEVGYAWGRGIRTVLLCQKVEDLKFDVKGQRCIAYSSIKMLEESLSRELKGLLEK